MDEEHDDGFDKDDRFEVWPENWKTVQLFLACATKWDMVGIGMGGAFYTGLNAGRIEMVLRMNKVGNERQVFDDLRLMEAEAKSVMNEKLKETAK